VKPLPKLTPGSFLTLTYNLDPNSSCNVFKHGRPVCYLDDLNLAGTGLRYKRGGSIIYQWVGKEELSVFSLERFDTARIAIQILSSQSGKAFRGNLIDIT